MANAASDPQPQLYLSRSQVAALLGITPRTVSEWVHAGKLPAPLRFNSRCLRWQREALARFLRQLEVPA